jgi:hypothetical protein
MFDNPVLHIAVLRAAIWTAAIAGGVGLVIGILAAWLLRQRPQPSVPAPKP